MSGLLTPNPVYKPFRYPWAYEAWQKQQQVHWLPEEVPLADDVKDWRQKLTAAERNLLTQIFRFFTQAAFLRYKEMKDKYDYMQGCNCDSPVEIARTLAVFGAFTEGLQLFASFAMLMNFPRFNKMKGMGQIVTWSVRDETLHTHSIIRLFRSFIEENKYIWTDSFQRELYLACDTIVDHEDAFIDLSFELGEVEGLKADDVKSYRIQPCCDPRQLGRSFHGHNFGC